MSSPFITPSRLPTAQFVREALAEFERPLTYGLVGHEYAPCGEQFINVPKAEGEAKIEPHRGGNNLGRRAMTAIGIRWRFHNLLP